MGSQRVVIDTNVLIAGLRSRRGASNYILQMVGSGIFEIALSVPVALEYEEVAKQQMDELVYTESEVEGIIGYLCREAIQTTIHFLWRSYSNDPKDDKILELAVASGCDTIITFNLRNFTQARLFGIKVLTPRDFLREIGE